MAALARTGLVRIAKTAITSRERLAVLRPRRGMLTVHTISWPEEIRGKGVDPSAVRDEYAEACTARRCENRR